MKSWHNSVPAESPAVRCVWAQGGEWRAELQSPLGQSPEFGFFSGYVEKTLEGKTSPGLYF